MTVRVYVSMRARVCVSACVCVCAWCVNGKFNRKKFLACVCVCVRVCVRARVRVKDGVRVEVWVTIFASCVADFVSCCGGFSLILRRSKSHVF